MNLSQRIGREVKRIRKKSGMNQTELAPLLGLDQSALSRVENGKQVLTVGQWVTLCLLTKTKDSLTGRLAK